MDIVTTAAGWEFLVRWLHFLSGVAWIGMLWYFNFVQTPFFGSELGGGVKGAMTRGLVPNALWWFRWGAMFTFLTGLTILSMKLHQGNALASGYMTRILTGALMGTFMWANVWFVIWPAQKVVIASAEQIAGGGEAIPEAAGRGARAGTASRINTLFSIPMLFFMASATHLPSLARAADVGAGVQTYWIAGLIVIGLFEVNGLIGPGASTQKPLTTVSGTIHAGLVLTAVLMILQIVLI
jgi:uncharacterized membrane protein